MIKRIFSIIFALGMSAVFSFCAVADNAETTHHIFDGEDIALLWQYPDHTFYLEENVFLFLDWEICGPAKDTPFSGMLDGKGHTITYLNNESDGDTVALFGHLTGTVRSVNFVQANINATSEDAVVAGIAVYNYGTIADCTFSGEIFRGGKPIYGKGITAYNYGTVTNCIDKTVKEKDESVSSGATSSIVGSPSHPNASNNSSVSPTSSVTTELNYADSSSVVQKVESEKTSSVEDDRQNAVEYFEQLDDEPKQKMSKGATALVLGIAAFGGATIGGMSIYREIKITRREKGKNKK